MNKEQLEIIKELENLFLKLKENNIALVDVGYENLGAFNRNELQKLTWKIGFKMAVEQLEYPENKSSKCVYINSHNCYFGNVGK